MNEQVRVTKPDLARMSFAEFVAYTMKEMIDHGDTVMEFEIPGRNMATGSVDKLLSFKIKLVDVQ